MEFSTELEFQRHHLTFLSSNEHRNLLHIQPTEKKTLNEKLSPFLFSDFCWIFSIWTFIYAILETKSKNRTFFARFCRRSVTLCSLEFLKIFGDFSTLKTQNKSNMEKGLKCSLQNIITTSIYKGAFSTQFRSLLLKFKWKFVPEKLEIILKCVSALRHCTTVVSLQMFNKINRSTISTHQL